MKIEIELTEAELKQMVYDRIVADLGAASEKLQAGDIKIEVKTTQNYKAEWEPGAFRARVRVDR
jgi:hypothetical protein